MKSGLFLILAVGLAASAYGQAAITTPPPPEPVEQGVDISADRLEYLTDQKLLIGSGRVTVRQGDQVLRADRVHVHTETHEAQAVGQVVLQRGEREWRGDRLTYNFRTRTGDFGTFSAHYEPYYIRAADSTQTDPRTLLLKHAAITTCPGDDPAYIVRARQALVLDGQRVKARNVVFFLGPVPILWLPFASFDAGKESNFIFLPGYRSRWGVFALTGYRYDLSETVRASTHLDYRSLRGVAFGQEFRWRVPDQTDGRLRAYYLDDQDPTRGSTEDKEAYGELDPQRYRLRLQHHQRLDEYRTLTADFGYLSDPFVLKDFFRREHRYGAEPETRATFTHRDPAYHAGLLVDKRLNDFYENVDRLPEATFDLFRRELGQTGLFYETVNSAAFLSRLFPEATEEEDYDALRLDSRHLLSYPTRHWGFLNIIPRAGYRGTFYSQVPDAYTITNVIEVAQTNVVDSTTNIVTSLTNETVTIVRRAGPDLRHLFETGVGVSFKAFRELSPPLHGEGGWRHVVEPYADYTLVPEPNLRPGDLYQFDRVDRLDKAHFVRLGMRHKLQTKRANRIRDWANINLFTDYYLDPEEDQEDFGPLFWDGDFYPRERVWLKLRGHYDTYEGEVPAAEARLHLTSIHDSSLRMEYRYQKDRRDLFMLDLDLVAGGGWGVGAGWRYDFQDSDLEEQSYYVRRRTECLQWALGFTGWEEEWEVWFEIWLTAFPRAVLGIDQRY